MVAAAFGRARVNGQEPRGALLLALGLLAFAVLFATQTFALSPVAGRVPRVVIALTLACLAAVAGLELRRSRQASRQRVTNDGIDVRAAAHARSSADGRPPLWADGLLLATAPACLLTLGTAIGGTIYLFGFLMFRARLAAGWSVAAAGAFGAMVWLFDALREAMF